MILIGLIFGFIKGLKRLQLIKMRHLDTLKPFKFDHMTVCCSLMNLSTHFPVNNIIHVVM